MEYIFGRPAGLEYLPGQFMNWIYDNQPLTDKKGNRRSMSFASSPTESDIKMAMRISDTAYKQSLLTAPIGTQFTVIGPAGKFILPTDTSKEYVFIAGGIGITPFRSMLKYIHDKKLPYKATLLYSNLCMAAASYLGELKAMEKDTPGFRLVCTMTGEKVVEPEWDGRCGIISEQMIREEVPDVVKPIYMIVGPPGMVEAMAKLLETLQVPKEHIVIEKFTGL